jgi:lipopolysaccharide/colanic/teichoic acid biosynthesis glycosyltransferase
MIFTILLVMGDAVAVLAAYSLAYILRVKIDLTPTHTVVTARGYFSSLLILLPFIILLFSLIGTYQTRRQYKLARIGRIITGAFGAMLFIIFIDYFSNRPIFPAKLVPLYGFGLSILFLSLARVSLYFARWWFRRRGLKRTVVLIGGGAKLHEIYALIHRDRSGLHAQAVVSADKKLATHKTFAGATRNFRPDMIIQIATREQPELDEEVRDFAAENYIDLKFVPRELHNLTDDIKPELLMDEMLVMAVEPTKLVGWGRFSKRTFDIVASGIFLIIFSWLYVIIAVINKLTFGKIIFRQVRLTRGNQQFQLYKFQTVRNDLNGLTPEQAFAKLGRPELAKKYRANGDFLPDDPRYNAWAKLLRKTSLDELPQLWNIFCGDISLVGPRALIPQELERYKNKHKILNVKSGITGLAVVNGRRDLPWDQRRKLDVYYVQNWSFGLDLQILFKTFWQVVSGRGAR